MKFRFIDLSHIIEDGLETYKGLEPVHICDYWSREMSAKNYREGTSFQIGKITMVANSGTYLDAPFHRFAGGDDLSQLDLEQVAEIPACKIEIPEEIRRIDAELLKNILLTQNIDLSGKAVLIQCGWSKHWGSEAYFSEQHPFLTEEAAQFLVKQKVVVVGIDSYNIDDTTLDIRPVHTTLLGKNILIVEHMTNLELIETQDFSFSAVPVKVKGMGTFPVRAYARISETIKSADQVVSLKQESK